MVQGLLSATFSRVYRTLSNGPLLPNGLAREGVVRRRILVSPTLVFVRWLTVGVVWVDLLWLFFRVGRLKCFAVGGAEYRMFFLSALWFVFGS